MSVNKKKKKVLVAISGGLDSAMVAYFLKKQAYEVVGVFLRLNNDFQKSEMRARLVCENLGINFYPINVSEKFEKEIIDYFLDSYKAGLTPNPCVKCNKKIKFEELLRLVFVFGADYLATGHYVKKVKNKRTGFYEIHKPLDLNKDQTYFLYNLSQAQLEKILFPLADFKKEDLRKQAEKLNIPSFKSESQDICFLVKNGLIVDHNDFLKEKLNLVKGEIRDLAENILGQHNGLPLYTLGQRKGIEIGGIGPYYVAMTDYKNNILYVTNDENDLSLSKEELIIKDVNWLNPEIYFPLNCFGIIRYRQKEIACVVEKINSYEYKVKFKKPIRAVTSGQSAVFYKNNKLLGGGIIE